MKINIIKNFIKDYRISMNGHAQLVIDHLKKSSSNHTINSFLPKIGFFEKLITSSIWKMRIARYYTYPKIIKNAEHADVAHVIDHQYGHLVHKINSKVKIITVHDLIPLIYAKSHNKTPYLSKYSLNHLKFFDQVIAISQNTKADILKYTDCPSHKIKVLKLPPEYFFNSSNIEQSVICKKFQLPINKKKILFYGHGFYKNIETSLQVFKKLIDKDMDVIFIKLGHYEDIKMEKRYLGKIFQLQNLTRKEVSDINKISDVLLFPSIYEGWGLPVLEALKSGLPVVCSNSASLPEVVENAALTSHYLDVNFFTNAIYKLLSDNKFYNQKKEQGITRAKNFDGKIYGDKLLKIYEDSLTDKFKNF